ncbi:MAG: DUF4430 domain-containing protein [Clostridiales bacterium]|nr:DUF4430 domain-containing protein [Clostridiales bacterium]
MSRKALIFISVFIIADSAIIIGVQSVHSSFETAEATAQSTEITSAGEITGSGETPSTSAAESSEAKTQTTQPESKSTTQKTTQAAAKSTAGTTTTASQNESTAKSTTAATTTAKATTTAPQKESTTKSSGAKTTAAEKSTTAVKTTAGTSASEQESFDVTISISCKNALQYISTLPGNGYFLEKTTCTVKNGTTVFELLSEVCKSNSISLTYQNVYYIQGIGGLYEKDCTSSSGWMYRVNGENPRIAAYNYTLSEGDVVEWYYVTSASDS